MKEIINKLKKSVLFYIILALIIFIVAYFILIFHNIQFRKWVYYGMIVLLIVGILIEDIKNGNEATVHLIIGIFTLILIIFITYRKEYIVIKDGKKYVSYVNSFFQVNVEYYDYINPFLVGTNLKIKEEYGEGGYPPFDEKYEATEPIKTNYYQDDKYFK